MTARHAVVSDLGPTFGLLAIALDAPALHVAGPARPGPHTESAALHGGIWWTVAEHPPRASPLPAWDALRLVAVTPRIAWSPQAVKHALPPDLAVMKHVRQAAAASAVLLALMSRDAELLRGTWDDSLIGDAVGPRLPGFFPARSAGLHAGALTCSLCGAGPTVAALCLREAAPAVEDAIASAFAVHAVDVETSRRGVAPRAAP